MKRSPHDMSRQIIKSANMRKVEIEEEVNEAAAAAAAATANPNENTQNSKQQMWGQGGNQF